MGYDGLVKLSLCPIRNQNVTRESVLGEECG